MNSLVETKLTKSEAIDVILFEAKKEIKARLREIADEIKRLSVLKWEDVEQQLKSIVPSMKFYGYQAAKKAIENGKVHVDFNAGQLETKLDPSRVKDVERIAELMDEDRELREKLYMLEDKSKGARTAVLIRMLESSKEGQQFLAELKGLNISFDAKLLGR